MTGTGFGAFCMLMAFIVGIGLLGGGQNQKEVSDGRRIDTDRAVRDGGDRGSPCVREAAGEGEDREVWTATTQGGDRWI